MSLIINQERLFVRDLFPFHDYLLLDEPIDPDETDAWAVVPFNGERIAAWLSVVYKEPHRIVDQNRVYDIIHTTTNPEEGRYFIQLRLQGRLHAFNFAREGTLDVGKGNALTDKDYITALQYILIETCGNGEAWGDQMLAITKIQFAILRSLPGGWNSEIELGEDIKIPRTFKISCRAYKKTRTNVSRHSRPYDREEGKFAYVEMLPLYKRLNDGSTEEAMSFTFRKGDFVDVLASFEVVTHKGRSPVVHLKLEEVVQLKSAEVVSQPQPLPTAPDTGEIANGPHRLGRAYTRVDIAGEMEI
ncbi:hypothetical protein FRB99_008249 [Tulasnella sp. 403]|nr:hypothetical protein FRB99_008249 [Tulasnella sp. 403]